MNQRTYLGTTVLDVAKGAVETFMKIRSRDPSSRWDRYMLLTFEDPPANVKAGWKESHSIFVSELKNLKAQGLTSLGPALKHTFDLLNVNRMQTCIDTYGQGRCPFYLEPAIIICLTDGRHLTTNCGVEELNLPMNNVIPGSELTKEPFRWDQRVFGLVLRMPAVCTFPMVPYFIPSADDSPIDSMCEVTGGRSFLVTTHRVLNQCLESLVQKCQTGVVIQLEKVGLDPSPVNEENGKDDEKKRPPSPSPPAWHNCRKQIYVNRSAQKGYAIGHWPIPEAFWPDLSSAALPPRSAHPELKFSCTNSEPLILENLPFDKYELEPSPLTQYILERRQPNVAWQVFIANSAKYSDLGHPFGYMKASTSLGCVNLFIMPYNYPVLIPLLDELIKVHKMKPTQKWRQQFDSYLKSMPVYYAQPLRRALQRMGGPNLIPDQMDNCLSYSVVSYLKKLKNQAKVEYEKLISSVGQKQQVNEGIKVTQKSEISILQRKDFNELLEFYGGNMYNLKQELTEYNTFTLAAPDKNVKPQTYRNPYDISRKNLLDQLSRMKANYLQMSLTAQRLEREDSIHNIPVQQMGNYQEYLKRMPEPLREIDTQPVRLHTFGNPFKVDKNITIDEADEAMPGQQAKKRAADTPPSSPRPNKRKPGPLPKDVPVRKLLTPTPESPQQKDLIVTTENENAPEPQVPNIEVPMRNGSVESDSSDTEEPEEIDHLGQLQIDTNYVDSDGISDQQQISLELTASPEPILSPGRATSGFHLQVTTDNHRYNDGDIRSHNAGLKICCVREVKKPGKNYDGLFGQLNNIQGSLDIRCFFMKQLIHEALRFKKRTLAKMLDQFQGNMVKSETSKRPLSVNHVGASS